MTSLERDGRVETALGALAVRVARHRRAVIAGWLVVVLLSLGFAARQTSRLTDGGWDVPSSAADRAALELEGFPGRGDVRLAIVVRGDSGERVRAALERARTDSARVPGITPGQATTLRDGSALLALTYDGEPRERVATATRLREAVVADERGATIRVVGTPAIWSNFQDESKEQLRRAEALGFPLVLVILLGAFGTIVAALAPLVLGAAAVTVTGAIVYWLAGVADMSLYVTNVASMIGIGVAVDYSLFVVSRFRSELRERASVEDALQVALASAGSAVVFSGITVVVSLASLFVIDVNAVRSIAAGAIIVVAVSVLLTTTLLPALLAVVGHRVESARVRPQRDARPFWLSWTRMAMRRPAITLAFGVAFMLVLAAPALDLRTENHGLDQLPRDAEVRVATERVARAAGPGALAPIHVISSDGPTAQRLARELRAVSGVARVEGPIASPSGSRYLLEVTQAAPPESQAGRATYRQVRALGERTAAPGAMVVAGGTTAFGIAVEDALSQGLWIMIALILTGSYLVLLVVLRSAVLPLKAVLMNLLSISAAFGVLVAIFQWGWLDWTGYDAPGYLDVTVPTLVLAVSFGLSMDYEVFLLTRIREERATADSTEQAVARGLAASAPTITSAAVIMATVFAVFALAGAPVLKELGVGLAVAIILDATIVRLCIVPAAMVLMGQANWWLPRPLERLLGKPPKAVTARG